MGVHVARVLRNIRNSWVRPLVTNTLEISRVIRQDAIYVGLVHNRLRWKVLPRKAGCGLWASAITKHGAR
jgi:hypothetical protein